MSQRSLVCILVFIENNTIIRGNEMNVWRSYNIELKRKYVAIHIVIPDLKYGILAIIVFGE